MTKCAFDFAAGAGVGGELLVIVAEELLVVCGVGGCSGSCFRLHHVPFWTQPLDLSDDVLVAVGVGGVV